MESTMNCVYFDCLGGEKFSPICLLIPPIHFGCLCQLFSYLSCENHLSLSLSGLIFLFCCLPDFLNKILFYVVLSNRKKNLFPSFLFFPLFPELTWRTKLRNRNENALDVYGAIENKKN